MGPKEEKFNQEKLKIKKEGLAGAMTKYTINYESIEGFVIMTYDDFKEFDGLKVYFENKKPNTHKDHDKVANISAFYPYSLHKTENQTPVKNLGSAVLDNIIDDIEKDTKLINVSSTSEVLDLMLQKRGFEKYDEHYESRYFYKVLK